MSLKIAIIKCSGGLNLGNNFINFGGQYVVKTLHPASIIETFEFYDSCLPSWNSSGCLTETTLEYIRNNFDLIYILSGSAAEDNLYRALFEPISKLGVPFIPIGIGCAGSYNESEQKAINNITNLPNCKRIITRDPQTYGFIEDKSKAISGMDLAFFAKDYLGKKKYGIPSEYAVVNFEPYGSLMFPQAGDLKQQLQQEFKKVYLTENTVIPSRKDIPDYIQIGYAEDLWSFYANAAFVVTTRIHSCVCSISNGVDFIYYGSHDTGGKKGRNTLFNTIGIALEVGKVYKSEDYQDTISENKQAYLKELKQTLL